MKLKLEAEDRVTILVITEDVAAQHVAILKAGLAKIFQTGKRTLLLDLSQLTAEKISGTETMAALSQLPAWSTEQGAQLVIATQVAEIANPSSRDQCLKYLDSQIARLSQAQTELEYRLAKLEGEKKALTSRLSASSQHQAELREARREHGELQAATHRLEAQVENYLKKRAAPSKNEADQKKMDQLVTSLVSILEQEGVLKVT